MWEKAQFLKKKSQKKLILNQPTTQANFLTEVISRYGLQFSSILMQRTASFPRNPFSAHFKLTCTTEFEPTVRVPL